MLIPKSIEEKIIQIRQDFPTLVKHDQGIQTPIHYLDNAATTFKPQMVLDAMQDYYINFPSNIHRGIYRFSQKASEAYEQARNKIARFINAKTPQSIIFTGGTTASSNMVARSYIDQFQAGDQVIITDMEHHSNLVNWQVLCKEKNIDLQYIKLNTDKTPCPNHFKSLITPRTKLLSITMASNTLGTLVDLKPFITIAKENGILVCVDMAQSISHMPIDVQALDIDFAFFSGHKMFGPTGVGVLYSKVEHFKTLKPFFYGGGMVSHVDRHKIDFADAPERYEGGTPPIAQAIGLGAAVDYILQIGFDNIKRIEDALSQFMQEQLKQLDFIELYRSSPNDLPVFSFNIKNVHAHDVASVLDEHNVAVRTGQHCTHILLKDMAVSSTVRASLNFYNHQEDILALIKGLNAVKDIFYVRS